MTARRLASITGCLVAAMLVFPTGASAWKVVFNDFQATSGSTTTEALATAKKCKGGPIGVYRFESTVSSGGSIEHAVTARLPAFPKFKPVKNVQLTFSGSSWTSLPPDFQAQILTAYQAFYEGTTTKYVVKKKRMVFRHPELVLLGTQVITAGDNVEKFKPKKGC